MLIFDDVKRQTNNNSLIFILLLSIPFLLADSFILVNVTYAEQPILYIAMLVFKFSLMLIPPVVWTLKYGLKIDFLGVLILFLIIMIVYIIIGLKNGNSVSNILLSIKNLYFWFGYLIFICCIKIKLPHGCGKLIFKITIAFMMLNFIYTIYVNLFYDGNLKFIYFYNLYNKLGMFSEWNVFRDGSIRAYGLVGACLTLSQLYIIPICFLFSAILNSKNISYKIVLFFVLLVFIYGMYLTQTRNPVFGLIFCFVFFITFRFIKLNAIRFFCIFIIYYTISIGIVAVISAQGGGDVSSQARIPYLLKFLEVFVAHPYGYGIGSAGIANKTYPYFFESSIATIFTDLGLFGGLFFWGILLWIVFKVIYLNQYIKNKHDSIFCSGTGYSVLGLLFITNFSNIYDSSLIVFSIILFFAYKMSCLIYCEHNKLNVNI